MTHESTFSAKIELEKIKTRLGSEHGKLLEEQSDLFKQLEKLTEEREAAIAPIESGLLQIYEGLRQQKRGEDQPDAVTPAQQAADQG